MRSKRCSNTPHLLGPSSPSTHPPDTHPPTHPPIHIHIHIHTLTLSQALFSTYVETRFIRIYPKTWTYPALRAAALVIGSPPTPPAPPASPPSPSFPLIQVQQGSVTMPLSSAGELHRLVKVRGMELSDATGHWPIPVARSYDGLPWESMYPAARESAVAVTECSSTQCTLDLPTLSGYFYRLDVATPAADDAASGLAALDVKRRTAAKLLMQVTHPQPSWHQIAHQHGFIHAKVCRFVPNGRNRARPSPTRALHAHRCCILTGVACSPPVLVAGHVRTEAAGTHQPDRVATHCSHRARRPCGLGRSTDESATDATPNLLSATRPCTGDAEHGRTDGVRADDPL